MEKSENPIEKLTEQTPFIVLNGDSLEQLDAIPDNSIDSVVCDPPYGLSNHTSDEIRDCMAAWLKGEPYTTKKKGFMGATWDSFVPGPEIWKKVFRVLKPGGHVIAFAGSRTQDLMSMALRLAGFECRDTVMWEYSREDAINTLFESMTDDQKKAFAAAFPGESGILWQYGSGFPKSADVSKQIDKAAGAEREIIGQYVHPATGKPHGDFRTDNERSTFGSFAMCKDSRNITSPATEAAKQWAGWGTSLKPAYEPALLFRKPLIGTVAENVLSHGTGSINIDECRVPTGDKLGGGNTSADVDREGKHEGWKRPWMNDDTARRESAARSAASVAKSEELGRWPANIILDGSSEILDVFPDSDGSGGSLPNVKITGYGDKIGNGKSEYFGGERTPVNSGSGNASRFFYCAKASKADRSEGLTDVDPEWANVHPTVKPTALMHYLVKLVTPPGGIVLDPFNGSGSTGKGAVIGGFRYIGIEQNPDYVKISNARITYAHKNREQLLDRIKVSSKIDIDTGTRKAVTPAAAPKEVKQTDIVSFDQII